jgi:hypothetical protein
MHGTSTLYTVN